MDKQRQYHTGDGHLVMLLLSIFLIIIGTFSIAQSSPEPINGTGPGGTGPFTNMLNCNGTPTFSVNLTGNPSGTWTSNPEQRAGDCCNPGGDNNCVQFTVTLDPLAEGIIFSVPDGCGASPSGSLFYQVDCGPLTSVGSPLCLNGTGPFVITFCKPGNNQNCYSITSIPAPASGGDVVTADGCRDTLTVTGVTAASTSWTSISPGATGQYNNYLNNLANTQPGVSGTTYTGQTTVVVTPQPGYPPVIQYRVCGTVIGSCSASTFCDTVSVSIFPTLFAQINPANPSICFGSPGTTLTAVPIGGTAPYTYLWTGPSSNGATTSTILASVPGLYTLTITDATGCPAATTNVTVTQFANTITANAGPDITVCRSPIPTITINGTVTGVSTGIWSGGSGTYSPSSTSLTLNYTPSAAELAAGTVTLTLTTTNNGSCPGSNDQVTITLPQFTSTLSTTPTHVTCNGMANGAIDLTVTGGFPTSTYLWSNTAVTQDLSGLAPGTYTVTVTDINGCRGIISQTITQPAVLTSSITAQTNVSCFGGNNGSVTVAGAGGTTAYLFSLNGGPNQASGTFSGLIAGTYTVTITDANGCTVNQTVTITQPLVALSVSTTQTNVLCFGASTGAINLTPAGGTAPYTYSWSNGATSEDLSGIPAGTYTVNVHDANGLAGGCAATTTVTITQPAAALTLSSTQVNVLCFGGTTGTIDLTALGGTAPYTYSWSNGATTQDLSGLAAGTYIVNVHDANGLAGSCAATATITITQPAAALTLATTQVNILCFGGSTGSINLTPAGGTPAYTYTWSNGATTQDLSGLVAGIYTVVVNDANGSTGGCTTTISVTITQPAAPLTLSTTQTNVLCFGGSTGAINLTPVGGTSAYSYTWSNGAVTQDISGLIAGTYTVVVNDANGSTGGCTATTSVTITQPAAPLTLSSTQVNILCNAGTTGSIDLTPAGGTAPYTYLWSNGATTQDISGLAAGTYTVSVNDANGLTGGCAATATITLTQPAAPLTLTFTRVNVLCNGGLTGSINLTPAGGSPSYSYTWSNGATTEDLSGLAAGTYTVIVNDANGSTGGCTATTAVTITQPLAPLTVSTTQTNVLCNGGLTGAINLTPAGGTAPYTYSWSNGATTQDLSGLGAGTYTVVVNDANGSTGGCTATTTVTITQPAAPLTLSFTQVNVLCNGALTGSIDLTPSGGTPAYVYSWSNGATTQDLSGLAAGVYTVNVHDANGLAAGCAASVTVTITQPAILTQTISAFVYPSGTNISCFGLTDGSVNLTIGGGNPGYSFTWSNGAVTEDLTNVGAGTYTVTVTDLNGCTINSTITLTQPALLTSGLVPSVYVGGFNTTGCLNNGTIDLTVAGGNPGYTYSWSNGATTQDLAALAAGNYTVTVTDVNGCQTTSPITLTAPAPLTQSITSFVYPSGTNISCFGLSDGSVDLTIGGGTPLYSYSWSNGAITQDLSNVPVGTYNVTVTDANGCQIISTITLIQPTILTTGLTPSIYAGGFNVSGCVADGSIDLTVAGGNPGYTYSWSNGAVTQDVNTLIAGNYIVTVTDINGCQSSSAITLTQPSTLNQSITATTFPSGTNISCFGLSDGNIDLTVGGGTPGYTYLWNTGATSQDLTNMPVGTYSVIITDANGCQISSSITLTQPPALSQGITATVYQSGTNISCFGLSNGNVDLTINGGNPAYTYIWSNGAITQDLSNVPAGAYSVTVTDMNGCTIASNITLIEPPVLTQAITATTFASGTNISCFGLSDGNVDLTIGGGNPGYTYSWSNGSVSQDLTNMPAGTYNVTVTDVNGCTIPSTITLTQPAILTQGITSPTFPSGTNISCFGFNDGTVDLTIGGGNPGYTYVWSNGAVTQDLTNLIAGTYNVTVTDINGCSIPTTITLTQPTALTQNISAFTYPSGTNISCFGLSDGSVDLTIAGGNPGYSYVWSNGALTQDLAGVTAGTYNVTVTDINGCIIPSTITLTEPVALTSGVVPSVYAGGFNLSGCQPDGTIDLTVVGGNPGYSYLWSNGSTNQDISALPAGPYTVTITDINGCQTISSITLTQPPVLTETITAFVYPSGTNISCFGMNDGSINLTIGGGVAPYSYAWSNGSASEDPSGLIAGTYSVIVTDQNGCQIMSSITLTQPPALTQTISAFIYPSGTNISCFGLSDGSVNLTIGGGNTGGYTYVWSNGATTEDLTGVPAGTYSVTATDVNGCVIPSSITLIQPVALTQGTTAFTYPSGNNISCFGLSDGSVDLTVGGGSPSYTYLWNTGATTEDISSVPAGTYTVTATDINGCTINGSITLNEPTALTQTISAFTYPSGTNISCFGLSDGSIDLTPNNGSPGYTYAWSNGSTNQDLSGLTAGTYSVVITDLNGCVLPSTITLVEPTPLTQGVSAFTYPSGSNISCFGFSDGSVDLTIGGGNPGYTYVWNTGALTEDISGIPAGTYTVTATDVNGCTIPASITLVEPTPLTQSTTSPTFIGGNNISCFGFSDGSIDLTIGGGSPGYTYTWSNGAAFQDISGLPIGTYTVTATDINGCQINGSITLTEPTPLDYSATLTTVAGGYNVSGCLNDGSIDLSVSGSNPGYTYSWSNSSTNQDISNLAGGTYTVTILDANGCQLIVDTTLTVAPTVTATAQVVSDYNGQDISCTGASDGSIDVTPGGGVPTYTFLWSNATNPAVSSNQTPTGLPSGLYSVLVTDQNGCTATTTVTLIDPPAFVYGVVVSTDYNGQDISCFGESDGGIDLTVSGATPTYTYAWTDTGGTPVSAVQDPSGLPAGTYTVLTTDLNGCTFTTSITLTEPPILMGVADVTSDFNGSDVSCFGSTDGSITVVPSGGTPTYFYQWINDNGTVIGSGIDQTNVGEGVYQAIISDLNGCTYIAPVVVTQPDELLTSPIMISNYFGEEVSCLGATDGIVEIYAGGGTPTYTYSWNTTPVFTGVYNDDLGVGTYTVIVTDANNCVASTSFTLDANPLPPLDIPQNIYGCMGSGVVLNSNSDPGSSCMWTFSDGQVFYDCGPFVANFANQDCYDLQLTVINPQGCINAASMTDFVCIMPNPLAGFYADEYVISNVENGTNFWNTSIGAETYLWDFGDGSPNVTNENTFHEFNETDGFNSTDYAVTLFAISEYGCIDSTVRYITVNPSLIFYVPNTFTPDGDSYNNIFYPVFSSGYDYKNYAFMIFNRWGELIYETNQIGEGWDGTYKGHECQEGVYTWKLKVMNAISDRKEEHVGHVTLLRGAGLK